MAIVLRNTKSTALTFSELDGNFNDLDGRTTTLEGAYVKTVNGVSPTSNAVTITTANIAENTNLYFTDARARASISVTDSGGDGSLAYNSSTGVITYTGPSASEVQAHISAGAGITKTGGAISIGNDQIKDTMIDFGTGTNQVSTTDLTEGTNLYFTNARADARIAAAPLNDLGNVDYTGTPTTNHVLTWDGDSWVSAAPPGLGGGEVNSGNNLGSSGSSIFSSKVGATLQFRKLIGTAPIVATENTNDITFTWVPAGDVDVNTQKIINVVDPTSNQHAATKVYVDTAVASLNSDKIIEGNSQVEVVDTGTGSVVITVDGVAEQTIVAASTTFGGNLIIPDTGNIGSASDTDAIAIAANGKVTFSAGIIGTLDTAAQTNITSVGTLTSLAVSGSAVIDEVTISGNNVTSNATNANLVLLASGTGVVELDSNIDMNSNKIVNVTDPTSNQEAATKAYVDAQVSSLSSDKINEGNSKVEVVDSGTGSIVTNVDGTDRITSLAATTTTATGHSFVMGAASNSAGGSIKFLEGTDNGTNGVTLQGAASTADVTVLLPASADTLVGKATTDTLTNKSLTDAVLIPTATTAGKLLFKEGTNNGTNAVTLIGPASTGDVTVTLPAAAGTLALANADTTGTAAIATTVTVADESSDTTCFPLFATAATGDLGPKSGSNLTFNSSSGVLTATGFAGALTGNVTGNASGSSGSCTGNSATATLATNVTVADESSDTACNVLFVTAATGDLPPKSGTNLTFDSANGNLTTTTFTGTATNAQYADLAEIYAADLEYAPGTVVTVGGHAEITAAGPDDEYLAGVISTDPAYLMNSAADGQAVALVGRVPVRVVGAVTKGAAIFATHHGKASAAGQGKIVGIALETNSDLGEKSVECMLKV